MIKTPKEIRYDLYGEKTMLPTRHVDKLMQLYADQFCWIKTTCGKFVEFDLEDYETLTKQYLFLDNKTGQLKAVWKTKNGKKTSAPVAKLILGLEGKTVLRYRDGNLLNIKRENIEVISYQQSHFKAGKPKNNTSGYKGVSWNKFAGKWAASIKEKGKKKHLGYFIVLEDAAKAYNTAAIRVFGKDYAYLNKIEKRTV